MQKFKIGDKVQCKSTPQKQPPSNSEKKGQGYKKNLIFKITSITKTSFGNIYWGGINANGCYENEIEPVRNIPQTLNNLASVKKALKA